MQITVSDTLPHEIIDYSTPMIRLIMKNFEGLRSHYDLFGIEVDVPFINNIKDSFTHFKKIVDCEKDISTNPASDNERLYLDVIIQFELFSEHITRAILDLYVNLLQRIDALLEEKHSLLQTLILDGGQYTLYDNDVCRFMHVCKNHLLDLRLGTTYHKRLANLTANSVSLETSFLEKLLSIGEFCSELHDFIKSHQHDHKLLKMFNEVVDALKECNRLTYHG